MAYAYSECVKQAKDWAQQALAEHLLSEEQVQALLDIENRTPDSLFQDIETRPLVVAFMGGTGVGKSTLLNRLAGAPIARTGVERPTSREVTLFHHQSLSLEQLPEGLPLESINIGSHQNAHYQNILWIDMPDFDSVETANRQLVLEWLPHIDVLIYVVSPERYRDAKAWRLLLKEGANHAWLFVLNKWDLGDSVQYEDFKTQLKQAGFDNPVIFKTSCAGAASSDEFEQLVAYLEKLSNAHIVKSLDQRGKAIRFEQLEQQLDALGQTLAVEKFKPLEKFVRQQWRQRQDMFKQAFEWPLKQAAEAYAAKGGGKTEIDVWDQWAQSRFDDVIDDVLFKAAQLQIPSAVLKQSLKTLGQDAGKQVTATTELECRKALVNPGNRLQRWTLKFLKLSEFLLPLAAMSFVSYQVFVGYYESVERGDPFLGVDFVAHSILLILLSWLIPFFLHKKLQPSLQKTADRGLKKGMDIALSELEQHILQAIDAEKQRCQAAREALNSIIEMSRNGKRQNSEQATDQGLQDLLMTRT